MKQCRECHKEKPLSDFYKHERMQDGHLNKCKECVKTRVAKYNSLNPEKVRKWMQNYLTSTRGKETLEKYRRTKSGKLARKIATDNYRKNHPLQEKANYLVAYDLKRGLLKRPTTCSNCNCEGKIHAHHCDYTKPLDIQWLCEKCHKEWHRNNKPIYE